MNLHVGNGQRFSFKRLLVLGMLVATTGWSLAQTVTSEKRPVKTPSKSRLELKTKANQMASGVRAAEAALTPAELAIAQQVEVGRLPCELGDFVNVVADAKMPGYFDVQSKKHKFRMVPVISSTGAIRLEDVQAGAVWLQLSNKSMLMSQKLGSRLADACMSPSQVAVAAAMEKNPPPSLLEPVPAGGLPATSSQAAAPSSPSAVQ